MNYSEGQYWADRSSEKHTTDIIEREVIYSQEAPFTLLKPKMFLDGDKWCALYGENIQDGVCGFGKSPAEAESKT